MRQSSLRWGLDISGKWNPLHGNKLAKMNKCEFIIQPDVGSARADFPGGDPKELFTVSPRRTLPLRAPHDTIQS